MHHPTSKDPDLTPRTAAFIKGLEAQNGPPLYTLTPVQAREVLRSAQSGPAKKADADIEDLVLPVGPTGSVPVRIVRPKGASGKLPFIFYLHGGGWVMGDRDTHDRLIRQLAAETGAAVVFPTYAPSPETQYPVPYQQAWAVLEHMVVSGDTHALDSSRIVLAGDSVGGNMAIVMALLTKERQGPDIRFVLLFYPVTDARFDTGSYQDFADGPWLTREAMQWFWDAYLPDKARREDSMASPLRASDEALRGFPETLVITAENDVLRDEGEAFAQRLNQAGVETACMRCQGAIHDFVMLDALAESAPARAAMCLATAAVKKHLR